MEYKYDKNIVGNYKSKFVAEKEKFKSNSYSAFSNSYLNTSGDSTVSQMASSLDSYYKKIETGYSNIDTYWTDYADASDSLESSFTNFSASCTSSEVNGYITSFIDSLEDNSSSVDLDTFNTLIKYSNVITSKAEKYNIDTEALYVYVIMNGKSINSEEDIDKVLNEGSEEVTKVVKELEDKGFPEEYATKLAKVQIAHPNWEFEVSKTGTTLDEAVQNERENPTSNLTSDPFKSDGSGTQVEPGWYIASDGTVKYYMDPTNFFNEKDIFMFEDLGYNSNITTEDINKAVDNTYFDGTYTYNGKTYTYAETFNETGKNNNVNSMFLTSRALQEQGTDGGVTAEMEGSDGKTYYNYYNFNAYGSSTEQIKNNALEYAEEKGWNNPYLAIDGSAKEISSEYIENGQNTVYYQKYNVVGNNQYKHQYMANVAAPESESNKTYESYKDSGVLDSDYTFVIPVYD